MLDKSQIQAPTGALGIRLFIRLFKIRLNSPKDDYHDDGDGCNMVERDLDGNQGGAEVINGSRAGSEYNLHLL